MYVWQSVCLSVCLPLSVCLSLSLCLCLSVSLSLCLSLSLSTYLSIYQSIYLSINLSLSLSLCLSLSHRSTLLCLSLFSIALWFTCPLIPFPPHLCLLYHFIHQGHVLIFKLSTVMNIRKIHVLGINSSSYPSFKVWNDFACETQLVRSETMADVRCFINGKEHIGKFILRGSFEIYLRYLLISFLMRL